jgi:hypothetical protein
MAMKIPWQPVARLFLSLPNSLGRGARVYRLRLFLFLGVCHALAKGGRWVVAFRCIP